MNAEALERYFNAVAGIEFRLGGLDCVRFVAQGLLIGWDKDYLGALGYYDRRSAVRRLREDGGLEHAVDLVLPEKLYPHELEPGDVALFDEPRATIGLVMPDYTAIKFGRMIYRADTSFASLGWRP